MKKINKTLSNLMFIRAIIVNVLHRVIVRRYRNKEQVVSDYDQGEWLDTLKEQRWKKCTTLTEFVFGTDESMITALVDGDLKRVSSREYLKYRALKLETILAKHALSSRKLIEIGCGAGRNLFALAHTNRWSQLEGVELSPNGREVIFQVSKYFNIRNIRANYIDLLDLKSEGYSLLKGEVVFSFYCLEQLPADTKKVMLNLRASGVRRVIHIEPTPELFNWASLKDLATVSYIWRQDYQRTIVQTARELERHGLIKVIEISRANFAPTLKNDPTVVVWEPFEI
jgi:hypothetical protein